MKNPILTLFALLVVIIGFFSLNVLSTFGIWFLALLFCLMFISYEFLGRFYIYILLLFFVSAIIVGCISIISQGMGIAQLTIIAIGCLGEILIILSPRGRKHSKETFPLQKRSDVLAKEIPKEEEPRIIITDVEKPRFLASKRGRFFHSVECPQSGKISLKDIMKFKSLDEALSFGFIKHTCIKE